MMNQNKKGFTLIELLVVIAIIGILAGMTFPAVAKAKGKVKVKQAEVEIANLAGAINQYLSSYGKFPTSKWTTDNAGVDDFTYGLINTPAPEKNYPSGWYDNGLFFVNRKNFATNNAEIIAILRDIEYYGNGYKTPNYQHARNPKKEVFIDLKDSNKTNVMSMVDVNGVYRDPWGNPYMISLDLNFDDYTVDWMYGRATVGADNSNNRMGIQGLVFVPDYNFPAGGYAYGVKRSVMVWSMGPDGKADPNTKADKGVNKDNILSWK